MYINLWFLLLLLFHVSSALLILWNTCYLSNVIECTNKKCTFLLLFIWTVDWNRTFWRYHIAHMNLQSMFVVIIIKLCWPFFFRRRRPNGGEIHRENWIIFLWLTKRFFHIHNMQIACVWEREEEHIETYKRWLQHTLTVRWLYHQCKLVPRGIFFVGCWRARLCSQFYCKIEKCTKNCSNRTFIDKARKNEHGLITIWHVKTVFIPMKAMNQHKSIHINGGDWWQRLVLNVVNRISFRNAKAVDFILPPMIHHFMSCTHSEWYAKWVKITQIHWHLLRQMNKKAHTHTATTIDSATKKIKDLRVTFARYVCIATEPQQQQQHQY